MKDGKAVGGIELGLQSIAEKVIFGRAPTCDVPLEHLSISRQHAVLSTDTAGNLYLTDMGSGQNTKDRLRVPFALSQRSWQACMTKYAQQEDVAEY